MALYEQYCDAMFCVSLRFVKNRDDAEDVLQEAFIKAFQRMGQYKGEVAFGAWLKRIVINTSIDFLKAKQNQIVPLDEDYMVVVEDDDWTVADGITVEMAKQAIDSLPEKYRLVVQLYLVEGYDHNEISEILGITESTCRTRLLRGKVHVKEMLNNTKYGTRSKGTV